MGRPHYAAETVERVLKALADGEPPKVVAANEGLGMATVYRWRAQAKAEGRGLRPTAAARDPNATPVDPDALAEENRRLKDLYAEAALELRALRQVIARMGEEG